MLEFGKKVIIFLLDGSASGPRTIEIGNWSGRAFYCKRASLDRVIKRSEFQRPGVYVLKSPPTDDAYTEKVYIGEAEEVGLRLKSHIHSNKIDFDELVFFTSKDELLTKAHIKYLESRLIQKAHVAKTAEIENNQISNLPTLSEADISDMEYFIQQIELILPIVGFSFLNLTIPDARLVEKEKNIKKENDYKIKSKGLHAQMYLIEDGFVIRKGSEAAKNMSASMSEGWKKLRERLIKEKLLIEEGEKYIFKTDVIFNSPSAASSVILGRQSTGPIEWINDKGQSLKDNLPD